MQPIELCVISEIVRTGDFRTPRSFGITASMFKTPEAREMYRAIELHFSNRNHHGMVPSERIMKSRFPSFFVEKSDETLPELCNILRTDKMRTEFYDGLNEAIVRLEGSEEPEAILGTVRELTSTIGQYTPSVHERVLHETGDEFLEWYEVQKEKESVIGLPWPWERLTEATQGIDDEDLVIIFGRPKSMKSFIAGETAANAFLNHHSRVLVYSCEMKARRFERRLWASLAQIDYALMKKGELDPKDEERMRMIVRGIQSGELRNNGSTLKIVPIKDCPEGMKPEQHLSVCIELYKPTLVLVDSFYRMADRNWEKQASLVTMLKTLTQRHGVAIIAVTQGTRLKAKSGKDGEVSGEEHLEDIAYTDAIGQEADAVIRVRKKGRFDNGARLLKLSIAGSRESEEEGGSLYLKVKPCILSATDRWVAAGEDDGEEEKGRNGRGKERNGKKMPKTVTQQTKSKRWEQGEITEPVTTEPLKQPVATGSLFGDMDEETWEIGSL